MTKVSTLSSHSAVCKRELLAQVPHPAIGGARRMQVPDPSQQHRVMVSAWLSTLLATTARG